MSYTGETIKKKKLRDRGYTNGVRMPIVMN